MNQEKTLPVSGMTLRLVGWGLFLAALVFLLYRCVISPRGEVDFRFFWLAGYMWNHGLDPYSAAYGHLGPTVLPPGNVTPAWVYPPHWSLLCRLLGGFSLPHALEFWRLLSGAMILGGTWWAAMSVFRQYADKRALAAAACGIACLIEPTANVLSSGQNGAVVYLGLCALIVGVTDGGRVAQVSAALLLSMKPQIGAPVILTLLIVPHYRLAVVIAGLLGILLSLPQLVPFGLEATIRQWLHNLGGYTGTAAHDSPNTILASTGPLQLVSRLIPLEISPMSEVLLGTIAAIFAALLMRSGDPVKRANGLLLLLASVVGLLPLHIYDMTIIILPLLLLLAARNQVDWAMGLTLLLVIRPGKIEGMLHVPLYGGGVSSGTIGLSIAGLLVLALALRHLGQSRRIARAV